MNTYDISLTILILFIFIILLLTPLLSLGIQKIKNNWVKYRCNPIVIPFAGFFGESPSTTFTFCVHNMVTEFMGYLLMPLNHSTNILHKTTGVLGTAINDSRKSTSSIRSFFTNIIQSVFGVLLNILIEIQKLVITMKDMMGKIVGIMATILYLLYGSMQAMKSAWKGPPGEIARALCFDPTTNIQLENGEWREIQYLKVGDIIKGNSIIEGVLTLANTMKETLYSLPGGEKDSPILVTGSHMILGPSSKFIPVKHHPLSTNTYISIPVVYSLITSNQKIHIGDHIFWDWNDDDLLLLKSI
jgi:hypothetical protein